MCRTIVNVTGDAAVSMIVAKSVGKLKDPKDVGENSWILEKTSRVRV